MSKSKSTTKLSKLIATDMLCPSSCSIPKAHSVFFSIWLSLGRLTFSAAKLLKGKSNKLEMIRSFFIFDFLVRFGDLPPAGCRSSPMPRIFYLARFVRLLLFFFSVCLISRIQVSVQWFQSLLLVQKQYSLSFLVDT